MISAVELQPSSSLLKPALSSLRLCCVDKNSEIWKGEAASSCESCTITELKAPSEVRRTRLAETLRRIASHSEGISFLDAMSRNHHETDTLAASFRGAFEGQLRHNQRRLSQSKGSSKCSPQMLLRFPVFAGCKATILHGLTYPKILCPRRKKERKQTSLSCNFICHQARNLPGKKTKLTGDPLSLAPYNLLSHLHYELNKWLKSCFFFAVLDEEMTQFSLKHWRPTILGSGRRTRVVTLIWCRNRLIL